ncbi:hypothetical protein [Rhodopseudomonas sp. B29]|uniref:hypothetical protein n=1 Tax=Rhodopseudomonas sp. B29 TaxID=95607 RepID=UPI0011D266C5|nr:hypothetical protein [Rhodopseudomonas sp. B29]
MAAPREEKGCRPQEPNRGAIVISLAALRGGVFALLLFPEHGVRSMQTNHPATSKAASVRPRVWPAFVINADFVALGAAIGLIAAIAFGAPHLHLP